MGKLLFWTERNLSMIRILRLGDDRNLRILTRNFLFRSSYCNNTTWITHYKTLSKSKVSTKTNSKITQTEPRPGPWDHRKCHIWPNENLTALTLIYSRDKFCDFLRCEMSKFTKISVSLRKWNFRIRKKGSESKTKFLIQFWRFDLMWNHVRFQFESSKIGQNVGF